MNDLECPIQLKVRFTDGTLGVRLLRVSDSTVRICVARGGGGVDWRAQPPPCGQLTRCFSAVAELLVDIPMHVRCLRSCSFPLACTSQCMHCTYAQYVNPSCAKALNYSSPGELVGRHVDEALTSDKNPIDVYSKIRQQLETGQVRIPSVLSSPCRPVGLLAVVFITWDAVLAANNVGV